MQVDLSSPSFLAGGGPSVRSSSDSHSLPLTLSVMSYSKYCSQVIMTHVLTVLSEDLCHHKTVQGTSSLKTSCF